MISNTIHYLHIIDRTEAQHQIFNLCWDAFRVKLNNNGRKEVKFNFNNT